MKLYYTDLYCYQKNESNVPCRGAFNLDRLPTLSLKNDFAAYIFDRGYVLSYNSLREESRNFHSLADFLSAEYPTLLSLIQVPLDTLTKDLKIWILKNGLSLIYKSSHPDKTGDHYKNNPVINYLSKAYRYFEGTDTKTFSKGNDIWLIDTLPFPVTGSPATSQKSLNFSKIMQPIMKEQIKEAVYYKLKRETLGTVTAKLFAIRMLCEFLYETHEEVTDLTQFNRALLEEYLAYLYLESNRKKNYRTELFHLKSMLEILGKLYECEPLKTLFLPSDFPKDMSSIFTYYSDEVLKKLHDAYKDLDKQTARLLIIHELLGLRISDTLTLQYDDIVSKDKPYVKIRQQKTGTYLKKYITHDILLLLNASMEETRQKYGDCNYIFVSANDPERPLTSATLRYRLQVLINTHDIRDEHGNLLTAATHTFRRTYGKKLCDLGLDDVTIAAVIGHHGTGSVASYRKMSSKVLATKTESVIEKRNKKIHKYRKGWMA